MQRLKYMAIILAAALLFSACASVEPRSSQEQEPAASPVVLPVLRQVTDLTEPLRKAIEDGTVLEFLQLHDNIAFEDEDETLGLDVVERFYQNFLDNVPDLYWPEGEAPPGDLPSAVRQWGFLLVVPHR